MSEYLDAAGDIVAHYEYSPFGETVVSTGPNASDFLHRFSTKPAEDNTGLVLYEYRPYSPSLGRWLSRDPIGERGGRNLYGFVQNRVVYSFDYLGLKCIVTSGPSVLEGAEWTLSKVDLACIGTSPKHCESVETEWTKAGEVSCCCRRFWFWKRTTNKSVNMTINKSENISFPITAYKPGDMPLTVPGFSTIAEGLGEVLGELGGLILGEIVSWRVDANDAKEITAAAQRTKPESTEEGTWPEDPCE